MAIEVVRKWSKAFSGQTEPVLPDKTQPPLPELDSSHQHPLNGLPKSAPDKHKAFLCRPFTMESLSSILNDLQDNKSCGIDNIPAEVLKYADIHMKRYLLSFYNKIMHQGTVPECLNEIKCVLIHKVGSVNLLPTLS